MTEQSLRSLIEAAAEAIETYRDPDIDEAQRRLSEVLVAAGKPNIRYDDISHLLINDKAVYVRVTWNTKGCDCDASYEIPASIIDAADPLKAAARYRLEQRRDMKAREVDENVRRIEHAQSALPRLRAELAEIEAQIAAA